MRATFRSIMAPPEFAALGTLTLVDGVAIPDDLWLEKWDGDLLCPRWGGPGVVERDEGDLYIRTLALYFNAGYSVEVTIEEDWTPEPIPFPPYPSPVPPRPPS